MKTREEQIEEIAKCMCKERGTVLCAVCDYWGDCSTKRVAKKIYAAGYRNQRDTVREFVERLKKELFAKCTYILTVDNPNDYDMKSDEVNALIDELADKYGAEVEE